MRVVVQNAATGAVMTQEQFPDYCLMFSDYEATPEAENHTEIAFDKQSKTAYFRVMQYGKYVPSCNRAIRLK